MLQVGQRIKVKYALMDYLVKERIAPGILAENMFEYLKDSTMITGIEDTKNGKIYMIGNDFKSKLLTGIAEKELDLYIEVIN